MSYRFTPITINLPFQNAPGAEGGVPDLTMWEEFLSDPDYLQPLIRHSGIEVQIPGAILESNKDKLQDWAASIASMNLAVSIVANPIQKDFKSGADSFIRFHRILQDWILAGGTVNTVELDDPIAMGLGNGLELSNVLLGIYDFTVALNKAYPNVFIYIDSTFPGNKRVSDSEVNIAQIDDLNGPAIFSGWRMDVDAGANPDWNDLAKIQDYCSENEINFSLICDAVGAYKESQKTPGSDPDVLWLEKLMSSAEAYKATGWTPDNICIRSWTGLPKSLETFVKGSLQVIELFDL